MKEDLLGYFDEWEASVESRKGYTKAEKSVMMLSNQTINGLRITSKLQFYSIQVIQVV